MPYVIKVENGYVKSGKEDTQNIKQAKQFDSEKQAKTFAQTNVAGIPYKIIELHEVYDEPK